MPFENFKRKFPGVVLGDDDFRGDIDELGRLGLCLASVLELVAERKEHRVAEVRVGRVESPEGIAVYAEGLPEVNVLAHLDFHIFRLLVEQMQNRHEGHGGVNVLWRIGVDVRVREAVQESYAADNAVVVWVCVHGTDLCRGAGEFGEDVVEEVLGFDVVCRVRLAQPEGGCVAEFVGAVGCADGPPLGFVLVRLAFIEHKARNGVVAFLDGAYQE